MRKLKRIPKFKNEKEEREFWQKVDSTKYVDYSKLERWTFPNLKLTSKPITIGIPESIIEKVKIRSLRGQPCYVKLCRPHRKLKLKYGRISVKAAQIKGNQIRFKTEAGKTYQLLPGKNELPE